MMQKLFPKRNTKYLYGYQRETYYQQISTIGIQEAVHLITPNGLARISTIQQKAELILGPIAIPIYSNQSYELHPFYQFLLKKIIIQQYVNHPKSTDKLPTILYPYEVFQDQAEKVTNNENECEQEDMEMSKATEKQQFVKDKFIDLLRQFKGNKKLIYENTCKKIQKLKDIQIEVNKLQKEALQKYKKSQFYELNPISDLQIYFLMENIKKLAYIRFQQQIIRLNIAQKKYKTFFNFKLIKDIQIIQDYDLITENIIQTKQYCQPYKNIKIKIDRTLNQYDPIIHSIMDLVNMRHKDIDYIPESVILIKDIFRQLTLFHQSTTKAYEHEFYHYLDPTYVLFDQLTLKPRLSYRPIVLDIFGVQAKPMSIENRLCFQPSPQRYYNFQSYFEMIKENKLILSDPYYGVKQFYQYNPQDRMNQNEKAELYFESQYLSSLHQHIQVQRYLLLSYYILNSKEFGQISQKQAAGKRKKIYTTCQRKKVYINKLKNVHSQIYKDRGMLKRFLGTQNKKCQKMKFNFLNEELIAYFDEQPASSDNLISETSHYKIKKLINFRNSFMKEIIRYITSEHYFNNVFLIMKHIFILLLLIFQFFSISQILSEEEKNRKGGRKGLREFINSNMKRQSNHGNLLIFVKTLYERIQTILANKQQQKYLQVQYMKNNLIATKYHSLMRQMYKQLQQLLSIQHDLNQIQSSQTFSPLNNRNYQRILKKYHSHLKDNHKKIHTIIKQTNFYYFSFRATMKPQKLLNDNRQESIYINQHFQFTIKKVNVMIHALIHVELNNIVIYESFVYPFLCVGRDGKVKLEIPKTFEKMRRDDIEQEFSIIEEIVGYRLIQDYVYFPNKEKYKKPQGPQPSIYQTYANKKKQRQLLAIEPNYEYYHPLYSKKGDPSKVKQFAPSQEYNRKLSFMMKSIDNEAYDPNRHYFLFQWDLPNIQQEPLRKRIEDDDIIYLEEDQNNEKANPNIKSIKHQ